MEPNVDLDIECWAECRLSSSTFVKIRLQKFGLIANSNVELNVDCRARHWILSRMSIVLLDNECWAECRFFSSTFAKIRLQKFGRIAYSNVELNVDCLARHSMLNRMSSSTLNVEPNVDCLAQHSPRFGFRSSDALLTRRLSWMLIV